MRFSFDMAEQTTTKKHLDLSTLSLNLHWNEILKVYTLINFKKRINVKFFVMHMRTAYLTGFEEKLG